MKQYSPNVLIVDDEAHIRSTMTALLRRRSYEVHAARHGEEAMQLLEKRPFDLLLLDICMPGMNGIELAHRARALQPDVAIILFTGAGTLETAIAGMHMHVFDYILKSSHPDEVLHQIEAALEQRRQNVRQRQLMQQLHELISQLDGDELLHGDPTDLSSIVLGDLELSAWDHVVRIGEQRINLTQTEFRILAFLAQYAGEVQTPVQIVRGVYGYELNTLEATDMIKPHISHLRHKMERDANAPRRLLTVRGNGYMLVASPAMAPA